MIATGRRAAWIRLMARLDVDARRAGDAYADLAHRYAESQRAYHTLDHAWQVVRDVQRLAPLAPNLRQVQAAAWLHDVIYDPRAADNEERSAAYAAELLQGLDQPRAFISAVQRLILLTAHYEAAPDDEDGRVLLDADLAILGAAPAIYAGYAGAIRQEFSWAPEATYRSARIAILQRFLRRPFIYHTTVMRQEREQLARANMKAEIERLSNQTSK